MTRVWVILCLLFLLCFPGQAVENLGPQWVNTSKVLNTATRQAKRNLGKERCDQGLSDMFPDISPGDIDWVKTFEADVKLAAEWKLLDPFAIGLVNCDVSTSTLQISTFWARWLGPDRVAKTIIHEYVHLLQCPQMVTIWGSWELLNEAIQGEDALQSMKAMAYYQATERQAGKVAALCVGEPVPGEKEK